MEGRKYATPCNKGGDIVQGNCLGVWGDMSLSRGCRDFSENRMIMFLMVSSCLYVYNHVCSIVSEITKNRRKLSEYIGNRFGRAVRIAKNLKPYCPKIWHPSRRFSDWNCCNPQFSLKVTKINLLALNVQIKNVLKHNPGGVFNSKQIFLERNCTAYFVVVVVSDVKVTSSTVTKWKYGVWRTEHK